MDSSLDIDTFGLKMMVKTEFNNFYIYSHVQVKSLSFQQGRNRLRNRIEAARAISAFALVDTTFGGCCQT